MPNDPVRPSHRPRRRALGVVVAVAVFLAGLLGFAPTAQAVPTVNLTNVISQQLSSGSIRLLFESDAPGWAFYLLLPNGTTPTPEEIRAAVEGSCGGNDATAKCGMVELTAPAGDAGVLTAGASGTTVVTGLQPGVQYFVHSTASDSPAGALSAVFPPVTFTNTETAGFVPIAPLRLADTRESGNRLVGDDAIAVDVRGVGTIAGDANAVVLNVTSVNAGGAGFVTVWPCDTPRPWASNLNLRPGRVIPNQVTAQIGDNGKVCLYSASPVDLVVDAAGYYAPADGDQYNPMTPVRVLDTRDNFTVTPFVPVPVELAGLYGVPVEATSVNLNVTVTNPTADGYVTVYPCAATPPWASNLNFKASDTVPNAVTTGLGQGGSDEGKICLISTTATDLVVDLQGYYAPSGESIFNPLAPERHLDTRDLGGKLVGMQAYELDVTGTPGLNVPDSATAVTLNITVTEPVEGGFLTAYPCAGTAPWASNLNFSPMQTVANAATVGIGAGGKVCFLASSPLHLVVDVNGFHQPFVAIV